MSKKEMTLGVDLSAYCTIELPDDTDLSIENLKRIAKEAYDSGDEVYEEDWSTCEGLRIVHVQNGDKLHLVGIPIEKQYHDAGQDFASWLNGTVRLMDAVESSAAHIPMDMSIEEVHEACIKIAGGSMRVSFACRKGATEEERDLAMLAAMLNAGASVDSVVIGERKKEDAQ